MSGVSSATTPCEVVYDVFLNKNTYGSMFRALSLARKFRSEGKYYCTFFTNPRTRAVTLLTGTRIINIYENFNNIVWCSAEEQIAGSVLYYINFFAGIYDAYNKAQTQRKKLNLYCKVVNVPSVLYPNVPSENLQFTIRGNQIIALMNSALGNGGVPSYVSLGGPYKNRHEVPAAEGISVAEAEAEGANLP